ncbi:MAG: NADH-quinone oxidoreductase subunit N [Dehalococcoidia bacterium]|nr:NADH-quinone oxidoreductase subunit N [Dehalococcoidia bacterium]MCB9486889.1 NADH-quinone oxidoreductase subunit N [Thermoflexaceae bacterium]
MNSLDVVGPQLAVLIAAGIIVVIDAVVPHQRRLIPYVALAGLAASALWTVSWVSRGYEDDIFGGTLALDEYAAFFYFLFAGITATIVLASIDWVEREGRRQGEYYVLVLTACSGLMFLAAARDLITIFLALELSSIPQYILAGWGKDEKSSEAGLKYLLLGAIASSLLLYGMALLYGLTGTTLLTEIGSEVAANGADNRSLLIVATTLLIAGFGFKMAIVPFQMWVPDVYQGAPTPVTAFLSVGSKAAAFAVVTRIFFEALSPEFLSNDWSMVFAVIAAVSMIIGNIMAIVQTDIKRMLGYSSIAQAGNILVGLAAVSAGGGDAFKLGGSGVLFFLAAYAFTNLGAFVAIIAISQQINSDRIKDYAGMWKRSPFLAVMLAFCLVSLTGIPPTAGFWAKIFIFNAAIRADLAWLVIIGVANSAVSAFYYLSVVKQMFLGEPAEDAARVSTSPSIALAVGAASIGVLVFFVIPMPLLSAAESAIQGLVPLT